MEGFGTLFVAIFRIDPSLGGKFIQSWLKRSMCDHTHTHTQNASILIYRENCQGTWKHLTWRQVHLLPVGKSPGNQITELEKEAAISAYSFLLITKFYFWNYSCSIKRTYGLDIWMGISPRTETAPVTGGIDGRCRKPSQARTCKWSQTGEQNEQVERVIAWQYCLTPESSHAWDQDTPWTFHLWETMNALLCLSHFKVVFYLLQTKRNPVNT